MSTVVFLVGLCLITVQAASDTVPGTNSSPTNAFLERTSPIYAAPSSTPRHTTADSVEVFGLKVPLYIGGLFAMPGGGWDGSGSLVAVQMALDDINANRNVLTGYELRMVWDDSQCDAGLGTRLFFEQMRETPQKIMLIGPACSTTAQAVAQTSFYWNLITVSYSAASSALSNRLVFPYFYRTYMPDAMLNRARLRLIKDFGWKRVATIHENQDLFSLAIDDMINLLKAENITVIASESFDEDPKNQVANLKLLDARIIIMNTYEGKARRVMCEAARQGMTGPGYAWFMLGWWSYQWWEKNDPSLTRCTTKEVTRAVKSSLYISMESALFGEDDVVTVAGITPLEFDRELHRRLTLPENFGYTYNGIATYGYDAAWAIALALNQSAEILKTKVFMDGTMRRLEDFTYDDEEMSLVFSDALDKTQFYGTSGPVSFLGADRISITQIEQLRVDCWPNWKQASDVCYFLVNHPATSEDAAAYCTTHDNSQLAFVNKTQFSHLEELLKAPEANRTGLNSKWLIGGVAGHHANRSLPCLALDASAQPASIIWVNCSEPLPFICQDDPKYIEVHVGTYDTGNDVLTMTKDLIWPGGQVPLDRTAEIQILRIEVFEGIASVVFICTSSFAAVGTLLAVTFLAFNIRYRSLRIVRMSSPNLNNVMLVGVILLYASVVVYGIDFNIAEAEYVVLFCNIRVWLITVGFVLAFGAMFSKTWRVHKVVAQKTPKRKVVHDRQLLAMVAVLLLMDVAILLPWQLIFPWRQDKINLPEKVDPDNATLIHVPFIMTCTGDYYLHWSIAVCIFNGLLLIFGAFLAWETRQVTIPALNDSKLIGISVYNVVILCAVGLAINIVLSQNPQILFIFNSAITIFCTTLTICIVFIPKVKAVYKNPNEDPLRNVTSKFSQSNSVDSESNKYTTQENLRLKQKVAELEKQLKSLHHNQANGSRCGYPHLPTGPSYNQIKRRSCTMGMWCCGLICGCSPEKLTREPQSTQPGPGPSTEKGGCIAARAVHYNEIDLSLEMTSTPSTSQFAETPTKTSQ